MLDGERDLAKIVVSSTRPQDRGFNTIALSHQHIFGTLQSHDRILRSLINSFNRLHALLAASPIPTMKPLSNMNHPGSQNLAVNYPRSQSSPSTSALELQRTRNQLGALASRFNIDQDIDIGLKDAFAQLNLVYTWSLASQDRVVALITSPRVQTWFTSITSCVLLVNEQMFLSEHETRRSPLSNFCAKFVDSILIRPAHSRQIIGNLVLAARWFCGQHTDVRKGF